LCYYAKLGGVFGSIGVMVTWIIWWSGILLEAVLLVRGARQHLLSRYTIFYSYVLFVFVQEFVRLSAYRWFPRDYSVVYWTTEFVGLVIGAAVVFEIYKVALRCFPGTARMARNLLLLVFAAVFAKALVAVPVSLGSWFTQPFEYLERDLRIVQGLAILALVSLFVWYVIPFGRNLKGILTGYSVFVAMSVVQLTLLPYLPPYIRQLWSYLQPISYLLVLVFWTCSLWSEHVVSEPRSSMQLENDYESLVASTRGRLRRLRARLEWANHL
jgi:hypothetical protein